MAARKILTREMISIASETVGGEKWNNIIFNTATSEIAVVKVKKLRK